MYQRSPTTLIRQRGDPKWGRLLMLAIGALFLACISFAVSVLTSRPHIPPQSALNDGVAALAFFLNGAPPTKPN